MERTGQTLVEATVDLEEFEPIVIELKRDNDLSWMLMPVLLGRVKKFCAEYEPDSNAEVLCRAIEQDFVCDDPRFHAIMTIQKGKCVGHTLTILETIVGILYANIIQNEIDPQVVPTEDLRNHCIGMIEDWARSKRCNRLHAYVGTEIKMRRLEIFYGFMPYKTLLRKAI